MSREDLRDLLKDRLERRGDLRDLILDRLSSRDDLRDLLRDRIERRNDLRDLILERVRNSDGDNPVLNKIRERLGGRVTLDRAAPYVAYVGSRSP